jgi:hypothetical protein
VVVHGRDDHVRLILPQSSQDQGPQLSVRLIV